MSDGVSVTVENMGELRDNFSELRRSAQASVIRSALRGGGNVVVKEARRRVPVRTGLGKKSITMNVDRDRRDRGTFVATIGWAKRAFYLGFVELGTAHMAASPFLRPALSGSTEAILQAFFATMGKRIEKIRAKAGASAGTG